MRYLILFCAILSFEFSFSQTEIDSKEVEDSSYYYWYNLMPYQQISFSESAIEEGCDYYYLRLRLAMAYYSISDYRSAMEHFGKALKFNKTDETANYYLNYCFRFLGLRDEEAFLQPKLSQTVKDEFKVRPEAPKFADFLYAEGGKKFSNNTDSIGDISYFHIGIQSRFSARSTLYLAYSSVSQIIYWGTVKQNQIYANYAYKPALLWTINGAFHYLNANSDITNQSPLAIDNFAYSLSAKYLLGKIDIKPAISYSKLNRREQIMGGFHLGYFAKGNDKTFLGLNIMILNDSVNYIMLKPELGIKVFKKFWIKADYLLAGATNVIEDDGFLVNNSIDKTIDRLNLMGYWQIKEKLGFYLVGQRERKEEYFNKIKYNFSTIVLGVRLII